ncbi:hypothetical protein AVEN_222919-1, partial [Araneus ventricosus]
MANVGKRKAFSIGAEKHGVNAFRKMKSNISNVVTTMPLHLE